MHFDAQAFGVGGPADTAKVSGHSHTTLLCENGEPRRLEMVGSIVGRTGPVCSHQVRNIRSANFAWSFLGSKRTNLFLPQLNMFIPPAVGGPRY